MVWDVTACLAVWWKDPERWRHDTVFEFVCDLTVACVCVTQGLLSVQSYADVPSVGGCGAVTGARALVVTAAATHWALRPGWPAGPCTFYWNIHTHTHTHTHTNINTAAGMSFIGLDLIYLTSLRHALKKKAPSWFFVFCVICVYLQNWGGAVAPTECIGQVFYHKARCTLANLNYTSTCWNPAGWPSAGLQPHQRE